jgi:hypothetical protein
MSFLRKLLEAEHSQSQMNAIVDWVDGDQTRFNQLVKLFLQGGYRITQLASWPLSNCAVKHPFLIRKHYRALINHMKDPKNHRAVKRNILRIFDLIEIPEKYHGELMNECIAYIENPQEAIAVQAFALGILKKLTQFYPEIRHEVEIIIESRLPSSSKGFQSRAKKYLS